ncbi:MAG: selenium-dependent molybdenum cofactor biosynthesis protein YqeB [Ardenticatenaceae bacterium]|nr:selenium-dependent molybdenum cofactor biosynthesis protein YqeB [Ardenticatenaceae bacterium]
MTSPRLFSETLVLVRGAGDLASGVAARLWRAGFSLVMTELPRPVLVRRTVALGEAVRARQVQVEELIARRAGTIEESADLLAEGIIPILVDPAGESIPILMPTVVIDGRMAKRTLDTHLNDAPLVIALGPGFTAGQDVHAVIETNRGHNLGRALWRGSAEPNTGTPGLVAGKSAERVLRVPIAGRVVGRRPIGARVVAGETLATVEPEVGPPAEVTAPFDGTLRGLIADDVLVPAGFKIGDVDARAIAEHCFTMSDKALAVGGGALEAILTWLNRRAD